MMLAILGAPKSDAGRFSSISVSIRGACARSATPRSTACILPAAGVSFGAARETAGCFVAVASVEFEMTEIRSGRLCWRWRKPTMQPNWPAAFQANGSN